MVTITIPDAFKSIGRADIMPKFQSAKLLYTLPAFIAGAKYGGLVGFCYAKLATVIVGFVFFVIIGIKVLDLNWKNIFIILYPKIIAVIVTIVALGCLKSLSPLDNYMYAKALINCITAIVMYFIVLTIVDRRGVHDLIRIIKRVIPEKSIL